MDIQSVLGLGVSALTIVSVILGAGITIGKIKGQVTNEIGLLKLEIMTLKNDLKSEVTSMRIENNVRYDAIAKLLDIHNIRICRVENQLDGHIVKHLDKIVKGT